MTDKELIEKLGGVGVVCDALGYDRKTGGFQRVQNWLTRGIPAHVKVQRPDLFMPDVLVKSRKPKKVAA